MLQKRHYGPIILDFFSDHCQLWASTMVLPTTSARSDVHLCTAIRNCGIFWPPLYYFCFHHCSQNWYKNVGCKGFADRPILAAKKALFLKGEQLPSKYFLWSEFQKVSSVGNNYVHTYGDNSKGNYFAGRAKFCSNRPVFEIFTVLNFYKA